MLKKVLFIDRDGTIIKETQDEQIDAFDKMIFYPKCIPFLSKIAKELDYELVMITNQDGLGTNIFPEDTFWPIHNFIMKTYENEGVVFDKVFLDRTFQKDNANTRKPGTGLLTDYFSEAYDLENSFVIGDRLTDVELAKNLGSKAIFINDNTNLGTTEISVKQEELQPTIALETNDWEKIYEFLKLENRTASIQRKTNETDIAIVLNLDGTGKSNIATGIA
ncbi:MAG: imidazoleglycerol-phosphate dehydratase/histidinol-phosphatase, partial [Flavobacterium sp.]